MPFALFGEGWELANWDLLRTLLKVLIKRKVISEDDICEELRACYDGHRDVVDRTAARTEADAANFLRLIMLELNCKNVPD
jgi:hypothetical protein